MKLLALAALGSALALIGAPAAEAGPGYRGGHRGHHHHYYRPYYSRLFIAAPLLAYPSYAYPAPAYSYPAPAYNYPAQAPVYVEQQPAPVAAPQGDWYYCQSARAYYPNVTTCAESWMRVAPRAQ